MSDMDTVQLPADPRVKQLAHDVVRENQEELVPIVRDFYEILAVMNTSEYANHRQISNAYDGGGLDHETWHEIVDVLQNDTSVEESHGTDYKLDLGQ